MILAELTKHDVTAVFDKDPHREGLEQCQRNRNPARPIKADLLNKRTRCAVPTPQQLPIG